MMDIDGVIGIYNSYGRCKEEIQISAIKWWYIWELGFFFLISYKQFFYWVNDKKIVLVFTFVFPQQRTHQTGKHSVTV